MDKTDKKRQKAERGGMTRSKRPSDAGFELGPTAARTVASIHRAPAQPTTTLPTTPSVCFLKPKRSQQLRCSCLTIVHCGLLLSEVMNVSWCSSIISMPETHPVRNVHGAKISAIKMRKFF